LSTKDSSSISKIEKAYFFQSPTNTSERHAIENDV